MSAGEVQRLEGLLARVQKNRNEPRLANAAAPAVAEAPAAAAQLPTPAVAARVTTPSPFEDAVESRLSTPAQPAAPMTAPAARAASLKPAPAAQPAARPASLKPAAPAAAAPQVAVARAVPVAAPVDPNAPARIATSPAPPSAPISQVASAHPSMEGVSFGELLRRSLSLRPR